MGTSIKFFGFAHSAQALRISVKVLVERIEAGRYVQNGELEEMKWIKDPKTNAFVPYQRKVRKSTTQAIPSQIVAAVFTSAE